MSSRVLKSFFFFNLLHPLMLLHKMPRQKMPRIQVLLSCPQKPLLYCGRVLQEKAHFSTDQKEGRKGKQLKITTHKQY